MATRFASTQAAGSFGPPAVPVTRSGQQTFGLICCTLQDAVHDHFPLTFPMIQSTQESGNNSGHVNEGGAGVYGLSGLGIAGGGMIGGGKGITCNPSGSTFDNGLPPTYAYPFGPPARPIGSNCVYLPRLGL